MHCSVVQYAKNPSAAEYAEMLRIYDNCACLICVHRSFIEKKSEREKQIGQSYLYGAKNANSRANIGAVAGDKMTRIARQRAS